MQAFTGDSVGAKYGGRLARRKPSSDQWGCLRPPEVAQKLGISSERVRQLLREGRLPGVKVGRCWFVSRDVLRHILGDEEWLHDAQQY